METAKQTHATHIKTNRVILLAVAALAIVAVLITIVTMTVKLNSKKIYPGVSIGEVDVGGMSAKQAREAVENHYVLHPENQLTITCGEESNIISLTDLDLSLKIDDSVDTAYNAGRSGGIFHRLAEIHTIKKEHLKVPVAVNANEELLETKISELASKVDIPEVDNLFDITETELIITKGHSGRRIIIDHAKELIKEAILEASSDTLSLSLETVSPKELNVDTIYDEICGEPVNATYKVENQKLIIVEEKIGVTFDKQEAKKIIESDPGDVIHIPIKTQKAEVTSEQVRAGLFPDLLATYSTKYNAGDSNRSYNIALACKKINGVVLGPGDIFSYNDTVGPRTASRGFRTANVYVGNKVEPGIGGGICQVSSTLFNTAVLSDLNIVYRTNHSLTVSYVPLGRDATVSDGSIDFKFENSTGEPIKIVASASGGTNTISIYGKKQNPNRTISMTTERTATYPAKLVQKKAPELPEGKTKVEQKGTDGCSYNTYKVTSENGKVVKTELLTKSTYVATDRIELIGAKPVAADPEPEASAKPDAQVSATTSENGSTDAKPTKVPVKTKAPDAKPINPAA